MSLVIPSRVIVMSGYNFVCNGIFSGNVSMSTTLLPTGSSSYDSILLDRSPTILTSDDFIRSNEITRTKWPFYVVIGHFVLTI